jgi:hypothetical protein
MMLRLLPWSLPGSCIPPAVAALKPPVAPALGTQVIGGPLATPVCISLALPGAQSWPLRFQPGLQLEHGSHFFSSPDWQ